MFCTFLLNGWPTEEKMPFPFCRCIYELSLSHDGTIHTHLKKGDEDDIHLSVGVGVSTNVTMCL